MQVTRRRLLGEWLTLLCVLSALAVWIASGGGGTSVGGRLEGTDQFAYDTLQQFAPIAPSSEAPVGAFDPLEEVLFSRFGIEVPIFPWPAAPARLLRVSTPPYVEPADVEALIAALGALGVTR